MRKAHGCWFLWQLAICLFHPYIEQEDNDVINTILNMNKKLMMALTAFLLTFTAQGQTMRSLWIAMPDSLFPYLDRNAKTIMADGVGEGIATGNRLSGQSRIDTLTADYLKATLSEASYIEMKRIANPQGDSILAVVTTFCGPEQESKLDFYDLSWHLLAGDVCAEASTVRPDTMSEDHYIELQQKIEPKIRFYHLSPVDTLLYSSFSLPMLSEADKRQVRAILQEKRYDLGVTIQQ